MNILLALMVAALLAGSVSGVPSPNVAYEACEGMLEAVLDASGKLVEQPRPDCAMHNRLVESELAKEQPFGKRVEDADQQKKSHHSDPFAVIGKPSKRTGDAK